MSTDQHSVRQHILATAQAIITGKGFSAVGLNEILSAAGVPKGSFYHYFKSKEQFGEALLADYVGVYLAELDALLAPDGSPAAARLMCYWTGWLALSDNGCAGSRCLVVKLSGEVADMSEAMRAVLLRGTNDIVRRLAACIEEGYADGSIPAGSDPQQCALALYEMWLGAALLTKLRREPSALDGALRATRSLLRLPQTTQA
ncbi:TetR/AcrR family transcriptional regulator [Massilia sp. MS-15]|uniref:TetR/AcrR family transcriptional regulator n=1 Tax=Massilia sp. MS-15 TaxID=2878200 RepID=UPI001CD8152A|nr:TetR/AcrR family transcriptional regulator [Massilia sp. MS-15]MCA1247568.1 TetR/AcrR family transcriptional regulator [Massilia sp. MS-15]